MPPDRRLNVCYVDVLRVSGGWPRRQGRAQVIEDGAVFQRVGVIVDVGAERRRMHRTTVEGTRPF